MTTLRLDIVGLWFKPPASSLVKFLPHNCDLEIAAEPNNPVDPNAIAVWLPVYKLGLNGETDQRLNTLTKDIYAIFHVDGKMAGWVEKAKAESKLIQAETYDDFFCLSAFQLGYIPKEAAANLSVPRTIKGKLKWRDPENSRQQPKPQVEFDY